MTTDERVVFEKQFGQAVADGKITNQKEAAQWAVLWMENSKTRELKTLRAQNAELLEALELATRNIKAIVRTEKENPETEIPVWSLEQNVSAFEKILAKYE